MIGIGIDTGGTYTDAVLYDMRSRKVLCAGKALTTKANLEIGIAAALDKLDPQLVQQAGMMALSTTLATNACVEDKGSRARLLMIGVDERSREQLPDIYESYGFREPGQISFLEGKPEHIYRTAQDPDWEELRRRIPEEFGCCDAVGVVQVFPRANGGRFEKEAGAVLREELAVPVTMACEMFDEADVLKRGAGTLLNARLIPLIEEFLLAVRHVMRDRGIDIPISIIRSDGSMMSEELARECPVETLLSGPAASAVGGSELAGTADAVIVDMGGTTTDVALIRNRQPIMAEDGIYIGKWKTMVKGMYADTFVLGGDCAVRFREHRLFIDNRRVIPLSLLAEQYPETEKKLRALADSGSCHTRMLHEFFVLQKPIRDKKGYTEEEQRICRALEKGPLMTEELAAQLKTEIYHLHAERLEDEGILMRSGLTPTDMMVIKGDFPIYAPSAAREAIRFLARNIQAEEEAVPDMVYELVVRKMYCRVARILLGQQFPDRERMLQSEEIGEFIQCSYENAKRGKSSWISAAMKTDLPLVGVGAPIHIFLPRVAELLGTRALIYPNSAVANAIGAIAGQIITRVSVRVKARYKGTELEGYSLYDDTRYYLFETNREAEEKALEIAVREVRRKAEKQGASGNPHVKTNIRRIYTGEGGLLLESVVEAAAADDFQVGEKTEGRKEEQK